MIIAKSNLRLHCDGLRRVVMAGRGSAGRNVVQAEAVWLTAADGTGAGL